MNSSPERKWSAAGCAQPPREHVGRTRRYEEACDTRTQARRETKQPDDEGDQRSRHVSSQLKPSVEPLFAELHLQGNRQMSMVFGRKCDASLTLL